MRFPRNLIGSCAAALTLLVGCVFCASAVAGVANRGVVGASRVNPLAGLPWGIYTSHDEVYPFYRAARGEDRQLLGLVALRPHARWFGAWYPDAESTVREYIANSTGGRSDVLAQLAVFRLDPWEGDACRRLPTAAQQVAYKRWIEAFAAGIGTARVALIIQPDLPIELCVPHRSRLPMQLVAYAARVFAALPHTTVYIDAGSADWAPVPQAATLLRAAGVRYARGFALDITHYDSTERQIMFGQKIVRALAVAHLAGRHFVINTSQNGRPFTYQQYRGPDFDNAAACATRASRRCVSLGIPPTTDVTNPRWGLSRTAHAVAARLVDAYLWVGRPWLAGHAEAFNLHRALALARTTPF